jgi:SAM-dependent methyltransferase
MGDRVGPTGHVLVTDLDTRWVDVSGPNVEVRQLDVRRDPLPERAFDLVHARLVLHHLPERDLVLPRLVAALKPGGWLVISEFDSGYDCCPNPADERDALINRVHDAFIALITGAGGDVRYGRRLHRVFAAAGLVEVHADGYLDVAVGGSPGSRTMLANVRQMRPRLVEGFGLSEADLTRYEATLEDPAFSWLMSVLFTACGRRPEAG